MEQWQIQDFPGDANLLDLFDNSFCRKPHKNHMGRFQNSAGWPWHRENRGFGSYFFQTGKTQGNTGKNFETLGKYLSVT